MGPGLKYMLARLGMLVAVFFVTLPLPVSIFWKFLIAIIVSMILSFFLLRRWRDQYSMSLQNTFERRKTEKDQLRSALAGDTPTDEPDTDTDSDGPAPKTENQH